MKIAAIRVAHVAKFTDPVALEGLSGGLDVLIGPNEQGKSTLLAALKSALTVKWNATGAAVTALQPYAGGTPVVETDLVFAATRWRLRKRFGAGRSALLTNLDSALTFRNADAEARLAELLSTTTDRAMSELLWIDQGTSFAPLRPDEPLQTSLRSFIAREIDAIADGGAAQRILSAVRKDLERLLTRKTRVPTGEYKAAIVACEQAEAEARTALERRAAAEARLDRLQALRDELSAVTAPQALAERAAALAALEKRLAEAEEARRQRDLAQGREKLAAVERQTAQSHLATLEKQNAELASAQATLAAIEPELVRLDAAVAELERSAAAAEQHLSALQANIKTCEERLQRAQAAAHARALDGQLAQARALTTAIAGADAELAGLRVTREQVAALTRLEHDLATLVAKRDAAAPRVKLSLLETADGRVSINGAPVPGGGEWLATEPLAIAIDGIGTIRIEPAGSPDQDRDRAREQHMRDERQKLCAAMGMTSLEAAEARLARRDALERERGAAAASLRAVAPKGLDALTADARDAARAATAGDGTASEDLQAADLEAVRAHLKAALAAQASAQAQHASAASAVRRVREERIVAAARRDAVSAQVAGHIHALGDEVKRAAGLAQAQDGEAMATQRYAKALQEFTAWRDAAPDQAAMAGLAAERAAMISARDTASDTQRRIREDMRAVEGELRRDGDDDLEAQVIETQAMLAAARARRTALAADVWALQRLEATISAVEATRESEIVAPVLARIEPFLARVFPDARLALDGGLAPSGLSRGDLEEPIERLSLGTREQIAIIARLGLAKLVHEQGHSVPLVLDDALIYADDRRLAAMFEVLRDAATRHQVIVFSCRESTFDGLGGRRLSLTPWQDMAAGT
jgi:hypothetical protein